MVSAEIALDNHTRGACAEVRDLADGFSIQSKLTNRMWFAVTAVAILILLPEGLSDNTGMRTLPFGFGKIDAEKFNVISVLILSIISIVFCSARSQALIAYKFAHDEISKLGSPEYVIKQRKYFDILSSPKLVRVGPLAVILRDSLKSSRKISSSVVGIIYFIIKHLALGVFFGIPVAATIYGGLLVFEDDGISILIKILCGIIASINILLISQNWVIDAAHTKVVRSRIPEL